MFRIGVLGLAIANAIGFLLVLLGLCADHYNFDLVSTVAWTGLPLVFPVAGFSSVLLFFAPISVPNRSLLMASLFFLVVATTGYFSAHFYFIAAVCFSLFLLQISLWLEDEPLRFATYLWTLTGILAAAFINGVLYWLFIIPILWRIYKGTAEQVGNGLPDESTSD